MSRFRPSDPPYEWATTAQNLDRVGPYLLGFPFDGTACFRKGAIHGPNSLRKVSSALESYSPYLHKDLEDLTFYDLGNVKLGRPSTDETKDWETGSKNIFETLHAESLCKGVRLLTLGGEHSISYAPIKSYLEAFPNLTLLHLDAHADLRDGYQGYHFSHASIIRRSLDHFKEGHQLIQYGIRSGTREEYQWMKQNGTLRPSLEDFLNTVRNLPPQRPIYLTLDLDYFDPAFVPGTGTPEPGGEDFSSFVKLIKILNEKNFVGADVVELSPLLDPTDNSSVFAAKIVREILLAFSETAVN